jgi:hypothetical protein
MVLQPDSPTFDIPDAWNLLAAVKGAPEDQPITLDFSRVKACKVFALVALRKALEEVRHAIEVCGLSEAESRWFAFSGKAA